MYDSPNYNYQQATNKLTTQKGLQDVAQNYGRFLSQERFRRGMDDGQRQFKKQFPRIAQGYNRRGLYHSGIRSGAQRDEAQNFQRQTDRFRQDFAAQQDADIQSQALRDADYQNQLLNLYAEMQRQRATGYDPFAAIRGRL